MRQRTEVQKVPWQGRIKWKVGQPVKIDHVFFYSIRYYYKILFIDFAIYADENEGIDQISITLHSTLFLYQ